MPEKKAGVGGEEVRTEAGRIMGREYLALLFVLYADEVFDKTKTFPLKGLEEKPHCMLSTPQGCSFSTAWQNSAEKLEFL